MKVGISLTSTHPDAKDPRQGALDDRANGGGAPRRARFPFFGDHHVSPTPYYHVGESSADAQAALQQALSKGYRGISAEA